MRNAETSAATWHDARPEVHASRFIDSLIKEALEAEEPTRLSDALPAPTRTRHVAERGLAVTLPDRLEVEDRTDRMTSLPTVTLAEAWLSDEDFEEASSVRIMAPRILCVTAPERTTSHGSRPDAARPGDARRRGAGPTRVLSFAAASRTRVDPLEHRAPKARRSKVPYLVGLAVGVLLGALATDVSARAFLVDTLHDASALLRR